MQLFIICNVANVQYDNEVFHGIITQIAQNQYKIKCLVPTKIKGMYKFEPEDHVVWYEKEQILASVSAPTLVNSRGFYKF